MGGDLELEVLRKVSTFCSSTTGMDRIARTTSFVSKFVKNHYCARAQFVDMPQSEAMKVLSKKMDNLSANLGGVRRVLRWSRPFYYGNMLVKFINQFKKAKTLEAKAKELHDILFYIFMIVSDVNDMVGWSSMMGLIGTEKLTQKSGQLNMKMYFYECCIWLSYYLREVISFQYRSKSYDPNNAEHVKKATNLKLSVIKYVIDVILVGSCVREMMKQESPWHELTNLLS